MADVNKDLGDAITGIDNLVVVLQRLAQSDDQLVKWAVGSSNRTGMELSAARGRFDYALKMRKLPTPAPAEPTTKK
jgi:hypothetical protein